MTQVFPTLFFLRLLILSALFSSTAFSQQFRWDHVLTDASSTGTSLVAINANRAEIANNPLFSGINHTGKLNIAGLETLSGLTLPSATVLRTSIGANGIRQPDWGASLVAPGGVEIRAIQTSPNRNYLYVCGVSWGNVSTIDGDWLRLPKLKPYSGPAEPTGFVAILNQVKGWWEWSFATPGILPADIVIDANENMVVTGSGCLAVNYFKMGDEEWKTNLPANLESPTHIATKPDGSTMFVLAREAGADDAIILTRINSATGAIEQTTRLGTPDQDFPAGLAIGPEGDAVISFNSHPIGDPTASRTTLARIRPDGTERWRVSPGTAGSGATIAAADIDLDSRGNAYIAADLNGEWSFLQSDPEHFDNDAAVIMIDGMGEIYDMDRSSGSKSVRAHTICAAIRDRYFLGGDHSGDGFSSLEGLPNLQTDGTRRFFQAVASTVAMQNLWIFRKDPDFTGNVNPATVRKLIRSFGISEKLNISNGAEWSAITGYATDLQAADVDAIDGMIAEREIEFTIQSADPDAGWALARLADGADASKSTGTFSYDPVPTTAPVRLYLIDTAVKHGTDWFSRNENLDLEETVLVRGYGDPTTSSVFEHGTRMLSLIAGPEAGAATRTPTKVLNYDIYASGGSTTSGIIASAIFKAITHHKATDSGDLPAVLCLASGSAAAGESALIRAALEEAVASGITVVISAGNIGASADQYIPSRYGTMAGVVCVGASGLMNERISMSNYGSSVDLYAPGASVRTLRFADPQPGFYDTMSGTSASAAYAAAAAIIELSTHADNTPELVEASMVQSAYSDTIKILQLPTTTTSSGGSTKDDGVHGGGDGLVGGTDGLPGIIIEPGLMDPDQDGDGIADEIERFHGSISSDPSSMPAPMQLNATAPSVITATFPVSNSLFDPLDPYTLTDGSTWRVYYSEDLTTWNVAEGELTATPLNATQLQVSLSIATSSSAGFLRIEVATPAPEFPGGKAPNP